MIALIALMTMRRRLSARTLRWTISSILTVLALYNLLHLLAVCSLDFEKAASAALENEEAFAADLFKGEFCAARTSSMLNGYEYNVHSLRLANDYARWTGYEDEISFLTIEGRIVAIGLSIDRGNSFLYGGLASDVSGAPDVIARPGYVLRSIAAGLAGHPASPTVLDATDPNADCVALRQAAVRQARGR